MRTEPLMNLTYTEGADGMMYPNLLGAGQGNEEHLWAGSVNAHIAKMRELYHSVSEKPEWLTEQDIERYEQQMIELQPETAEIEPPILPVPLE